MFDSLPHARFNSFKICVFEISAQFKILKYGYKSREHVKTGGGLAYALLCAI